TGHAALLLTNGKVLVTGGGTSAQSCEIFDPSAGSWSVAANMNVERTDHTATLLKDGRVLVVGGNTNDTSSELYDPLTDTWTQTPSIEIPPRSQHTASLLPDGRVFIFGGVNRRTIRRDHAFFKPYESIQLTGTDGTAPYTFTIETGNGTISTDGWLTPFSTGSITVGGTDAEGATAQSTVTVATE